MKTVFFENGNDAGNGYAYSLETEIKLINYVRSGDFWKVQELLRNIFEGCGELHECPSEMAQCLYYDMIGTTLKISTEVNILSGSFSGIEPPVIEKIVHCKTVNEMYGMLIEIYSRLCDYFYQMQLDSNCGLKERILRYLNENDKDPNLTLTTVADHFGIGPTYLSQFFKEKTGGNFNDYHNKLKMRWIKQLLRETPLTLGDIAEKVGYANSTGLIRAFKKNEGITPGQYKTAKFMKKEEQGRQHAWSIKVI